MSGFPDSVAGRRAEWYWRSIRDDKTITGDDIAVNFAASWVAAAAEGGVPVERALEAVALNGGMRGATLLAVRELSPTRLAILYRRPDGDDREEHLEFDPNDDHKMCGRAGRLPGGGSMTAVIAAGYRAVASALDGGRVFDDRLAARLISVDGWMTQVGRDPNAHHMRHMLAARSRIAEDAFGEARSAGVAQYVVLGAGLDTFAYRNTDPDVRVYEVDHGASQSWKRERLTQAGIECPDWVRYVDVDFTIDDLDERLATAGFDHGKPAVVAWLGVTYYLDLTAIRDTLERVGRWPSGTTIVFDYFLPEREWDKAGADVAATMRFTGHLRELEGEPWLSYFTPDELNALLRPAGFTSIAHFTPADIKKTYLADVPLKYESALNIVRASVG